MTTPAQDKPKPKPGMLSWRMTAEELEQQVREYDSLSITKSYRGITALLIVLSAAATLIAGSLRLIEIQGYITVALYLPLAFFVYHGHRWAMGVWLLLWTVDKGWQFIDIVTTSRGSGGRQAAVVLAWWLMLTPSFVKALRVESAKRKLGDSATPDASPRHQSPAARD